MKRFLMPLMIAAPLALVSTAQAQETRPIPKITVSGEGEATVSPDMALLTLAVVRQAKTAREALDANNEAMTSVIEAMKEAGIEARDIQTSGLSISPQYVYPDEKNGEKEPRITGYEVTNTLSLRVRDLTKLGEVIDQSVTLGVNQGGGITFTNDDPSATLKEARKRAVTEALDKARTLAEAAGVELGDVIEISERSINQPPMPFQAKAMRMEAAAPASVPIEAGENSYHVQVNVTLELKQ
ncbi:hypothetical protein L598_004600000230 [Mesorhizobium sp. J18]|uniref:SIMPL domain-containing protein n=1 Tax=Mesorhizobium sp. J18 TaxID=935263 RepID=UPI00119C3A2C|nr:SIMPL domain-containing protein [Mesorhizobium sp. J18]TWG92927.1 hypothetical protein L598_004600000230 [Mesorhizobium sp. J18]